MASEIKKLERRIDLRNPELDILYSERTKTRDALTTIKNKNNESVQKLKIEIESIQSEIKNIQNTNRPIVSEIKILANNDAQTVRLVRNLKERLSDIEKEIKRLQAESEPIKEEIIKLSKQIEIKRNEINKLTSQIDPAKNDIKKLQNTMSGKLEELKNLEIEKANMENYLEEVENRIREYEMSNTWDRYKLDPLIRQNIDESELVSNPSNLYSKPKLYKKIGPSKKSRSKLSSISEEDGRVRYAKRSRSKKNKRRSRSKKNKRRSRSRKRVNL